MRPAELAILRSAEDSHSGLPQDFRAPAIGRIFARAADRHLATSIAANGATIIATSTPMMPRGILLLLPPPEEQRENCRAWRIAAGQRRG